jgi:hypothetical protein
MMNDARVAAIAHELAKYDYQRYRFILTHDIEAKGVEVSLQLLDNGVFEMLSTAKANVEGEDFENAL